MAKSPLVMELSEALRVKKDITDAKRLGYKTNYPSEHKVLAGFVETYCQIMGVRAVYKNDLERLFRQYRAEWVETRKYQQEENVAWGKMIQIQKFLENWRESYHIT